MSIKTLIPKMLSYLARCDLYSYYLPNPTEEGENPTKTNNSTEI